MSTAAARVDTDTAICGALDYVYLTTPPLALPRSNVLPTTALPNYN